jgi:hypothetical protein
MRSIVVRAMPVSRWTSPPKASPPPTATATPIGASQAGRIAQAFRHPLGFAQVYMAGFPDDAGFCKDCNAPYCSRHWHVSESGTGYCPRRHGRSLDPRWSPLAAGH